MNDNGQDFKYYEGDKIRRPPSIAAWIGVLMFLAGLCLVAISDQLVICGATMWFVGVCAVVINAAFNRYPWTHDTEKRHRAEFQKRAAEGDQGAQMMLEGEKGYQKSRIPGAGWALLVLVLAFLACAYGPYWMGLPYK